MDIRRGLGVLTDAIAPVSEIWETRESGGAEAESALIFKKLEIFWIFPLAEKRFSGIFLPVDGNEPSDARRSSF